MPIAVIGDTASILVTATGFAEAGLCVTCVGLGALRGAALLEAATRERDLQAWVQANVDAGRLTLGDDPAAAAIGVDAVFLSVHGDGGAQSPPPDEVALEAARALTRPAVLVDTVAPFIGSMRRLETVLRAGCPGGAFDVASIPSFPQSGASLYDKVARDRVVIGTESARARAILWRLYRPTGPMGTPVLFTTPEGAELARHAAGALQAVVAAFAGELAELCREMGTDPAAIVRSIALDARAGAGAAFAPGTCAGTCGGMQDAADELARAGSRHGHRLAFMAAAVQANTDRAESLVARIADAAAGLRGRTVAVLGLASAAHLDRRAFLGGLRARHATVRLYDPEVPVGTAPPMGTTLHHGAYEAAGGAHVLAVVGGHDAFRKLDPVRLRRIMRGRTVFDAERVFSRAAPGPVSAPFWPAAAAMRVADPGLSGQACRSCWRTPFTTFHRSAGLDPSSANALLGALSDDEVQDLLPRMSWVRLVQDQVLFEAGDRIEQAYFVERGILALTAGAAADEPGVQVAMIGREGLAGSSLLTGAGAVSVCRVAVQMPGAAMRIPAQEFLDAVDRMPGLAAACQVFAHRLMAQLVQEAACGVLHGMAARCADWLLMAHERGDGQDSFLTHDTLARALGVNRSGVTVTLGNFTEAGAIALGRGRIRVADEARLDGLACGCRKAAWRLRMPHGAA